MRYGIRLLPAYLRDHRRLLLALAVCLGGAAALFALYALPLEPLCYVALVCAVIGLCFFAVPDYISYVRRVRDWEILRENVLDILDTPDVPAPRPEQELLQCVQALCGKVRALESDHDARRRDMLEYYTLWVHQIKTPLSALRLLVRSAPDGTGQAMAQELFKVERYVEMVLGYLRLDSMTSDLRLERCAVRPIVSQAVKKFAPQFIYQKLSLDLRDFDNQVVTDEKWLLFVLEQLLSNAVKYTSSGGITIWMDENDVLYLRDTGVGIAPEDLPRVFERGFTGANGRLDQTSSGLGLYLVKQILDRLGTRIELDSTQGKGTEVRLFLHRPKVY